MQASDHQHAPDAPVAQVFGTVASSNTRRMYDSSWKRFEAWCEARDFRSLPAQSQVVAQYLRCAADELDGNELRYKSSTFSAWLAAIGDRHTRAGHSHPGKDPVVADTLREIRDRRIRAGETPRQTAPLMAADLRIIVMAVSDRANGWVAEVAARRDIALLVLGFSGAMRREELGRLEIRDLKPTDDGEWLAVRLRGTKSDVEYVYLPRGKTSARWCPWCAYLRWLRVIAAFDTTVERITKMAHRHEREGAVIDWDVLKVQAVDAGGAAIARLLKQSDGNLDIHDCGEAWPRVPRADYPLFRSLRNGLPRESAALTGGSISRMLRRRAAQAGIDPDRAASFSGHALRAGAAIEAFDGGASLDEVMNLTRHKSAVSALRYERERGFPGNAAARLGL